MTIAPLTINDLTQATLSGSGVFDILMRANKEHLEQEYQKNRIRGPEYSQVYLGSLQHVLAGAIQFLLEKDKTALEAQLLEKQIELINAQIAKTLAEKELIDLNKDKIPAEIALLEAQARLVNAQADNEPKRGAVLVAEECKLRAEYDVLMESKLKTAQEVALLSQKVITERAQTSSVGVDDGSIIGRQKLLYKAQADGFKRDAEQKAAKILVDTWATRRTTDEDTPATSTNGLHDASIGQVINKLLQGLS